MPQSSPGSDYSSNFLKISIHVFEITRDLGMTLAFEIGVFLSILGSDGLINWSGGKFNI